MEKTSASLGLKNRKFGLLTDGSSRAMDAMLVGALKKILLEEFFEKGDQLIVIHLTDSRKTRDPTAPDYIETYTPRAILEEYKMKLTPRLPSNSYTIVMEEIDLKWKSPKQQLAMIASKQNCNYIFLGAIGRKGEK